MSIGYHMTKNVSKELTNLSTKMEYCPYREFKTQMRFKRIRRCKLIKAFRLSDSNEIDPIENLFGKIDTLTSKISRKTS